MSDWRTKLGEVREDLQAREQNSRYVSPEERTRLERQRLDAEAARDAARVREESERLHAERERLRKEAIETKHAERQRLLGPLLAPEGPAGPESEIGERLRLLRAEHDRLRRALRKVTVRRDWLQSEAAKVPLNARNSDRWSALQNELFEIHRLRQQTQERLNRTAGRLNALELEILALGRRREARADREQLAPLKRAIALTWRVLPPGFLLRRRQERSGGTTWWNEDLQARLEFLDSLGPLNWYEGSHLASTIYFVAEFPNVALADAPEYGNALYWVPAHLGDWRQVFRLDKQDARRAGARRIIHTGDWEQRVRDLVRTSV